jgi:hypothetical protein
MIRNMLNYLNFFSFCIKIIHKVPWLGGEFDPERACAQNQ